MTDPENVGPSVVHERQGDDQVLLDETSSAEQLPVAESATGSGATETPEAASDFLGDLQRLQAEFANYRKRTAREQAAAGQRANAHLVERLLPVLDNFDLALAHGEGGSGINLAYKELMETLRSAGLEEVSAEGQAFDPQVHDAVETRGEGAGTPVVAQVYRRGYRFGERLLRPAMVVVDRQPGVDSAADEHSQDKRDPSAQPEQPLTEE